MDAVIERCAYIDVLCEGIEAGMDELLVLADKGKR